MASEMISSIVELTLKHLPERFDLEDLKTQALAMIASFDELLISKECLLHTQLTYCFRLRTDELGEPETRIIIGLKLRAQSMLNFDAQALTPAAIEMRCIEDRSRIVKACQDVNAEATMVAVALANRITAANMNRPVEDMTQPITRRMKVLINASRKEMAGLVADRPWQFEFPNLPKYQWQSTCVNLRVQLVREKYGFTLILLNRKVLPAELKKTKSLLMPERPMLIEDAALLDRAEHTGSPIEISVRLGSILGSDDFLVADFAGFV